MGMNLGSAMALASDIGPAIGPAIMEQERLEAIRENRIMRTPDEMPAPIKEYTLGFCTTATGMVLLAFKDGKGPDGEGWNGIGGKLKPGEDPVLGMRREWWEETKLPHVDWTPAGTFGGPGYRVYVFAGRLQRLPDRETDGDVPTAWCHLGDCMSQPLGSRRLVSWARVALAMSLEAPSRHDGSGNHLELRL